MAEKKTTVEKEEKVAKKPATKTVKAEETKKTATKTTKTTAKVEKEAAPKAAKTTVKAEAKTTTKSTAAKTETKTTVKTEKVVKSEGKTTTKKVETKTEAKAEVVKKPAAKKPAAKKAVKGKVQEFQGTGKRKTSVARIRLTVGTGAIIVNGESLDEYFDLDTLKTIVKQPLVLTDTLTNVDVIANVYGGGKAGQAGAIRHGITRALMEFRPELRPELKKAGFVTRDARKKERKKYGLHKARKAPQFSKR